MGRFTIPDAKAPDESKAAPAAGEAAIAAEPLKREAVAVAKPPAVPAAAHEPVKAPKQTFEAWAVDVYGIVIDERGWASGVKAGKRIPGATKHAAFVNGARRLKRIPIGKTMTRVEFDAAIDAAKAIEIK